MYNIVWVCYAAFQKLQFKLSEQPCQQLLVMDGRACLHEGSLKLIGEAQSHDSSTCKYVYKSVYLCLVHAGRPFPHRPTSTLACVCVCVRVCVCVCEDIVHLINTPRGSAQEPVLRWLFHSLPQAAEARLWRSCRPSFSPTVSYSQSIRSWMHVWALHACWRWQCRHGNQLYLVYTSDQLMM